VAGVPEEIAFETKPEIALEQIRRAVEWQIPPGVVLADASYVNSTHFRQALAELDLLYVVGVESSTTVWSRDDNPCRRRENQVAGRPQTPAAQCGSPARVGEASGILRGGGRY
jgi:SRSO17 transposase